MLAPGHEPGFCMMCTMQNHVIQVFANSGNVIKPIGVLNELKSKSISLELNNWSWGLAQIWLLLFSFAGKALSKFIFYHLNKFH